MTGFQEPDFQTKLIDIKRYLFDNLTQKFSKVDESPLNEINVSEIPWLIDAV